MRAPVRWRCPPLSGAVPKLSLLRQLGRFGDSDGGFLSDNKKKGTADLGFASRTGSSVNSEARCQIKFNKHYVKF